MRSSIFANAVGQSSLQLSASVKVVEMDVPVNCRYARVVRRRYLVEGAAPAGHADLNFGRLQAGGESFGCELCAWVGVGELGSPLGQGLPQRIKTNVTIQGVGDLTGEEIAVVPAIFCDLIDETTRKRGGVGAPLGCRFSADSDAA